MINKIGADSNIKFGASFNRRNANTLRVLLPEQYTPAESVRLNDMLDWFKNKTPDYELEITNFVRNPIPTYEIYCRQLKNSITVVAKDIFDFFDGIKSKKGIIFTNIDTSKNMNEQNQKLMSELFCGEDL